MGWGRIIQQLDLEIFHGENWHEKKVQLKSCRLTGNSNKTTINTKEGGFISHLNLDKNRGKMKTNISKDSSSPTTSSLKYWTFIYKSTLSYKKFLYKRTNGETSHGCGKSAEWFLNGLQQQQLCNNGVTDSRYSSAIHVSYAHACHSPSVFTCWGQSV